MGILPLQFIDDINRLELQLKGSELISIYGIEEGLKPGDKVTVEFKYLNGDTKKIKMLSRRTFL